jgi:tripartite-type tricarboxylate transporter receptor subunit TctC
MRQLKYAVSMLLASLPLFTLAPAHAADVWPDKPVRIIFPFATGGGGDFAARFIAQRLTVALGQNVYVENRPGAAGLAGIETGVRSAPDGYTIMLISNSYTVNPSVYHVQFDSLKDITPIVQISEGPLLIVTNPKFAAKTIPALIALAKQKPGAINYGTPGVGSAIHLSTVLFNTMANIKMTNVPYKSTGLVMTDVIGGHVDLSFSSTASSLESVKGGLLSAVAVTGKKRLAALPDVPTVEESGLPGYEVTLWHGLIGPKNMPPAVVARFNLEANKALKLPDATKALAAAGVEPAGGTQEDFRKVIAKELVMWHKVATDAGISPS